MKTYKVLELFSGVGGLSYGFSKIDSFEIVAANEINADIAQGYMLNHPTVNMINLGIEALSEDILMPYKKDTPIDIIVGGPPCQSYSTLGNRQMDDRANLFMEYKRVLRFLNPALFVFENVSGLCSMDNGRLLPRIVSEFESIGYSLKYKVLDAANYGVPQHRERIILVGMRGSNIFVYPEPTHGPSLKPYVTLSDAIGDLPCLKSGESSNEYAKQPYNEFLNYVRSGNPLTVSEHIAPKNNETLTRIMETLKDGQGRESLPEGLRPKKGFGNTYAKLWWDRPSQTITRNFACPSSSRCIHPRDSRALTIREGARLQSFPDNYKFYGSQSIKRLEIGNAVPPLLSMAIARKVEEAMSKL